MSLEKKVFRSKKYSSLVKEAGILYFISDKFRVLVTRYTLELLLFPFLQKLIISSLCCLTYLMAVIIPPSLKDFCQTIFRVSIFTNVNTEPLLNAKICSGSRTVTELGHEPPSLLQGICSISFIPLGESL